MKKKIHNLWLRYEPLVLLVVLAVAVLAVQTSCTATRNVAVERVTHDTLTIATTDTIREYVNRTVKDTLIENHTYYITLNDHGEVTHEKEIHDIFRGVYSIDSTNIYRAKADSLQKIVDNTTPVIVEVERKLTTIEKFCMDVLPSLFVLSVLTFCIMYFVKIK